MLHIQVHQELKNIRAFTTTTSYKEVNWKSKSCGNSKQNGSLCQLFHYGRT